MLTCMYWHPTDFRGKSCRCSVSHKAPPHGAYQETPEITRLGSRCPLGANKSQSHTYALSHDGLTRHAQTMGPSKSQAWTRASDSGVCNLLRTNSVVLKTCVHYAGQMKYNLILSVLARISQEDRSIRLEMKEEQKSKSLVERMK